EDADMRLSNQIISNLIQYFAGRCKTVAPRATVRGRILRLSQFCSALFIIVLFAGSAQAQEPRPIQGNTLTVSGSGEAKASPDVAYVTVGVVTEARRAQDAAQTNAA